MINIISENDQYLIHEVLEDDEKESFDKMTFSRFTCRISKENFETLSALGSKQEKVQFIKDLMKKDWVTD